MPPTDENMPDFDSMTPEELMAWMETLAERQGAVEGFTTEKRVDIAEVDPDSAGDVGPGYIPYGMSEEEWAKRSAKEEEERAQRIEERRKAREAGQPPTEPAAPPVQETPPAPEPTPEPAAPAASGGGEPDFDNMTPEELMAWMETLAERQGAVEGFTTEKRVDIAEVDPDSAGDVGPGYIPYGMSEEEWAKRSAKEEEERAQRIEERRKAREASQETPPAPAPIEDMPELDDLEDSEEIEPAASLEDFALPDFDDVSMDESTDVSQAAEPAGLDWLENLAAEQGGDFGEMDLSGLGDELANLDLSGLDDQEEITEASDPMDWLNEMSGEDQGTFDLGELEGPEQTPFADQQPPTDEDVDPIEWLESLAARQENPPDSEEFMTSADLDIPIPDEIAEADTPGYEDYAFEDTDAMASVPMPDIDDIDALDQVSLDDPDDPVAWLDSLASQQGNAAQEDAASMDALDDEDDTGEIDETDADVLKKLNQGISDPNDMENWMSALLEKGASRTDVPDYIEEEEEDEAIQAQIPDWLLEQVGAPPEEMEGRAPAAEVEEEEADLPDDLEGLDQPLDETDIPDWLQEDVVDTSEMENIFEEQPEAPAAEEAPTISTAAASAELEVDTDDPWVQAFEEERTQSGVPDWYKERLANAQTQESPAVELTEASFDDETRLPAGQLEAVPDWLGGTGEAPPQAEPAPEPVEEPEEPELVPADTSWLQGMVEEDTDIDDDDMPDWLRESADDDVEPAVAAVTGGSNWLEDAEIEATETVPDWLLETVGSDEDQPAAVVTPDEAAPAEAPQPQQAAMVPAASSPAPPVPVNINVQETLRSARQKIEANEVESGLQDYEAIVRVNAQLDTVVSDLSALVSKPQYKQSATAHRVLGDGLMRQGKLQDALDTYRKALNLL